MKQIQKTGVLLLLVFCLLLGACSGGEEEVTETSEPRYAGLWYAADEESVLELSRSDQSAKFYLLYPGFYEYGKLETGSYTETDGTLKVTLDGVEYTYIYYSSADVISFTNEDGTTITFVRKTEVPKEHPQYDFPDYASMSCEKLVTLGDYKSIDISKYAYQKGAVNAFTKFYGTETFPTVTDRAAQDGDYVDIDYTGYLNGEKFDGGEAAAQKILICDLNSYIEGFVAGINGHTVGEEFDVPLTFPEDYGSKDLAGKAVVFRMKLNAIYRLPLTDEQIAEKKDTLGCETYQEFLDQCAESASAELIWENLEKDATFAGGEVPEAAYLYFYQYYCDYYHSAARNYNTTYEAYLSMYNMTDAYLRYYAKKLAVSYMIPFAIAAKEGLTWTEKEYKETYDGLVQKAMLQNQMNKDAAIEYVENTQMKYLQAELTYSTVQKWLVRTLLVKPESTGTAKE